MAAVTPTGMYSLPLSQMADLLADLSAFHSWLVAWGRLDVQYVGTPTGRTEALKYISFIEYKDDPKATVEACLAARPRAIIGFGDGGAEAMKETEPPAYDHSQELEITLEEQKYGDTRHDQILHCMNHAGAIFEELEGTTGRDGHLLITEHRIISGPGFAKESDVAGGDLPLVGATWQVRWEER